VLKETSLLRVGNKTQMQGAEIPRNEQHKEYVSVAKDEAQAYGWRFSSA